MKLTTLTTLIAIALLFLIACEKEPIDTEPGAYELWGEWRWIESSGGGWALPSSPASTSEERILRIRAHGTYSITVNGEKERQGAYTLRKGKSIYGGRRLHLRLGLFFASGVSTYAITLTEQDTLRLSPEAYDAQSRTYVRN